MKIRELGRFERYTPDEPPEGLPSSIMFARNDKGEDWYGLIHGEKPAIAASAGILFATAYPLKDGRYEVQAVTADPTAIFPADAVLLRISGYKGSNALDEFGRGRGVYDPGSGTIEAIDRGA